MIEQTVKYYLDDRLVVPVYMDKPADPGESYVVLTKTGSRVKNKIYSSTFSLQSVAPTLYQAAQLNELVKMYMDNIIVLDSIISSTMVSDYEFTNTATKERRYQAVYDIKHYYGG